MTKICHIYISHDYSFVTNTTKCLKFITKTGFSSSSIYIGSRYPTDDHLKIS